MFKVLTATLVPHADGYDHVEDAMNVAAAAAKESPGVVSVVIDTEENNALLIIHDGYAYLADAAPEFSQ